MRFWHFSFKGHYVFMGYIRIPVNARIRNNFLIYKIINEISITELTIIKPI